MLNRKTITVHPYGEYPTYVTSDNDKIARMLHLSTVNNRLHDEQFSKSVKECTAEYKIDKVFMTFWICIHALSSISSRDIAKVHFIPFILDGWV